MNGPTASGKGLLRPQEAARHIDLRRYPETGALGAYVERYWSVRWDLPEGAAYESVVIPHPCVNLSFMPVIGAELHGPGLAVSRHPLTGEGRVFGVKFRPGGFTAFSGVEAAALADWSASASTVFGAEADELNAIVMSGADAQAIAVVSRFLAARAPERPDPRYGRLLAVVRAMLEDRSITRVDQVAARFAMSAKTLQRLFQDYVGLGPKTLIRRYRIHDAADRLAEDPHADLARLAAELGWSDQAHFTHDFKDLIGSPPAEYAAQCASAGRELVMAHR
ncbi:helix-turn-helix domain-containing protein [Glycomyces sp. TRM65418]|uniref:AraC family transcriptional regulator n=1 Tax=Glycomyces sp. TRM65418 TaxID=2867006 RepID=UPI001CE4F677|nr:helix-turn-helix domain-containing protein [Glycomyces sp. TRM65418]MCC3765242.1 helix-turn-helix domain-containing protein [Glycomyces sp. TRM65418]QZD54863.1 helix-turn-helix domain-containing protein [Glycomyces sp. TRM65418]